MQKNSLLNLKQFRRTIVYIMVLILMTAVVLATQDFNGNGHIIIIINGIMCMTILGICICRPNNSIFSNMFQYRYIAAMVLLVLLVVFEVHGSSLSLWGKQMGYSDSNTALFGVPRAIRTDEWAVNTPMALSQYMDTDNPFSYFSKIIRGDYTDVFIVYGQPVKDIAVIFRPFHWGYLFLSQGKGLSFFWMGRLIALLLVSIEFGMLITKKNKYFAVSYSFFIAFAPVVQWWFAINGFVEMLIFGQLAIVLVYRYLMTDKFWWRLLYAFILGICGGAYILTFYPSWQVPFLYVYAGVLLYVLLDYLKKGMLGKRDIVSLVIFCSVIGVMGVYIFSKSGDTISSVMNTAFPGKRVEVAGGAGNKVLDYLANIFFAYNESGLITNVCELSVFFDLFPVGIVFSFIILFKEKVRDKLLIILLIIGGFLYSWCLFDWPEILAKITFLSYSQSSRTYIVVGFINILLLFRSAALLELALNKKIKICFAILGAVLLTIGARIIFPDYMNKFYMIFSAVLLFLFIYLFLGARFKKNQKFIVVLSIGSMLLMGGRVNPVDSGIGQITDQPLYKAIREISSDDDGLWIVEGEESGFNGNFAIMAGAPTINSTHVYPNKKRWEIFNREPDQYEYIYNRYAHMRVNLQNDNVTDLYLNVVDEIIVDMNIGDLKRLNVKYILSKNELTKYNNNEIEMEKKEEKQGFNIYEVKYN